MISKIEQLEAEAHAFISENNGTKEDFRIHFLGSKQGKVTLLFQEFKEMSSEEKRQFGKPLNILKSKIQGLWKAWEEAPQKHHAQAKSTKKSDSSTTTAMDPTLPGYTKHQAARHPLDLVKQEILDIFRHIGFGVSHGPEMEDDWHNFTALNLPEEHPARDMQDTFFLAEPEGYLLRTHTSSVQIRHMETNEPPIRTISPGRVFRNEAISSRAHCIFHQIEGLFIDEGVSFADLKKTVYHFVHSLFGKEMNVRFRPSYFPFTEPSAEVDVYWGLESESDYRITKGTGWLEIMGCGMVDEAVLRNVQIDPERYSGFAFGMGIERIAMLKYGIPDLRMYFENDMRFLSQFA